jgi:hypothetical protein
MAGYRIYGAWDDFRVSINALKVSGSKPPSWTSYKGGEVLAFSDQAVAGNEEVVFFTIQMPHHWKLGTDVEAHVHWVPEDNSTGNVRWQLTYSWANEGAAFPAQTSITVNAAAPGVADIHTYSEFPTISGTGKGMSSMMICELRRNSSNAADTFTGKSAYLLEFDLHYEIDSFGSDTESSKPTIV